MKIKCADNNKIETFGPLSLSLFLSLFKQIKITIKRKLGIRILSLALNFDLKKNINLLK